MNDVWLTSQDPEPPPGTIVETQSGLHWTRLRDEAPCSWVAVGYEADDIESWTKVAGNYGPVKVIKFGDEDQPHPSKNNRARGRAIRARMAETGEPYTLAARRVDEERPAQTD